ncbi:MAG: thiamine pyrophosphate-binding protein, partial [Spirochaetales bacterium]
GAKDPVIIAGTGIHRGRAHAELRALAELLGIPVATSYMGKSAIPETHDLALGTMGAVGQKAANEKITSADVLLVVGSCLAPENTKMLAPDFIRPVAQKIIQIDIEPRNAGWTYPIEIGVTSDARLALIEIANAVKSKRVKYDVKKRVADILKFKTEMKYFDEEVRRSEDIPLAPERVVHEFNKAATAEDLVVLDGGNNRIWVTHHFKSLGAGQVFAPGGAAGVGYAPPASVAAGILNPGKKVFCFSGDGGLMMQLYSLEMARQYNVPVTFMVLNNSCLGNVMDYQAHERRVMTQYPTSNFAAIAKGVGIDGVRIEKPGEIAPAIAKARANEGPMLLEFIVQDCPHFRCMG